jgi:hypothetical protein
VGGRVGGRAGARVLQGDEWLVAGIVGLFSGTQVSGQLHTRSAAMTGLSVNQPAVKPCFIKGYIVCAQLWCLSLQQLLHTPKQARRSRQADVW